MGLVSDLLVVVPSRYSLLHSPYFLPPFPLRRRLMKKSGVSLNRLHRAKSSTYLSSLLKETRPPLFSVAVLCLLSLIPCLISRNRSFLYSWVYFPPPVSLFLSLVSIRLSARPTFISRFPLSPSFSCACPRHPLAPSVRRALHLGPNMVTFDAARYGRRTMDQWTPPINGRWIGVR